jgi:hypothetical protein
MIVTGWHNGSPNLATGGGYGIRIEPVDREAHFHRKWAQVALDLGAGPRVLVSLSRRYWAGCPELRSKHIGRWMLNKGVAPWPKGSPPKLRLEPVGEAEFRLTVA